MPKSVAILGATSPTAQAVAHEYARDGYAIVLGARDDAENEIIASDLRVRHEVQAHAIHWDAQDFERHPDFVQSCTDALGGLPDGVVFCAGYMEENDTAFERFVVARTTVDVNYTGAVSILNLFAKAFEERKSGFIGALTSVAGDRGRQSNFIYGSTKSALTAYLQGLRNRLYHSGVTVTTIKPGFMDTPMTYGSVTSPLTVSPEFAAKAIKKAIDGGKHEVYVPFFWRYIMLIIKSIPEFQFKKMKM